MNIGQLLDEGAFISSSLLTAIAFTALGVWRKARCAGGKSERRVAFIRVVPLMALGALLMATSILAFPRDPLPPDTAVPTA